MTEPAATLPFGLPDDVPIDHDPLDPHPEHPTPIELVTRLTRSQREKRVERLVEMAHDRYREALTVHGAGKNIVAVCSLVSGGNDSYTVAHLFRDVTTHQVHANTGTGIAATREFVRQTAREWGVPLIEESPKPGEGYFDFVLGKVWAVSRETGELVRTYPGGFPASAMHAFMQQRLKGRCLERIPHRFGISGSRTDRVVFIAGRRRSESKRRASVPHYEEKGTVVWSSPIAVWHKADLRAYRLMHGDVPVNPVAQMLGMSGECGCLANAVEGEPQQWRDAYPDEPFIQQVAWAEQELLKPEYDFIPANRKTWGNGTNYQPNEVEIDFGSDSLCGVNCGPDPLLDLMDPLFELDGAA